LEIIMCKRWDALRYHPGNKNLNEKNTVD
jgi:hypothetical protein